MKVTIKAVAGSAAAALILISTASCSRDRDMSQANGQAPHFQTSEEAVAQGKKDILEVLRISPEVKLGMDAAQVERSTPDQALSVIEVDFQKLLEAGSADSLRRLAGDSKGNATPLLVDGQVIGLIETSKGAKGWSVSAIGNQLLEDDLNAIKATPFGTSKLDYFEVPNIQARIFEVSTGGKAGYLTRYDGFSLQRTIGIEELLPRLRQDALEFQKLYGDQLKEQKLVK
ncbi:MAG: hypothetical protein H7Y19_15170 [Luteimonas sp.]|nr:hypothetical protein [Luteimonas sp.]